MAQVWKLKDTTSRLKDWSVKTGKTEAQLGDDLNGIMDQLPPTMSAEKKEKQARAIMYRGIRGDLQSKAEWYKGKFFGAGNRRDVMDKTRKDAIAAYETDPEKAIREGIVRVAGDTVTVINRKEYFDDARTRKNPGFNKPLKPFWIKTAVGVICKEEGDGAGKYDLHILALRGDKFGLDVPVGEAVRFRANEAPLGGGVVLNSAAPTAFETAEDVDLPDEWFDMFDQAPDENISSLGDLAEFHAKNKDNVNRIVFVEADVLSVPQLDNPNQSGGYSMPVADDSMDTEDNPVMLFMDKETTEAIDYVSGTHVSIIGSTGQRDDGSMNISVYAVNARQEDKLTEEIQYSATEE